MSESEVAQSGLTPSDPMDCSLPGSSIHGIFRARVLEWGVPLPSPPKFTVYFKKFTLDVIHSFYRFGLPRWCSGKRICLPTQEMKEMWVQSLGQQQSPHSSFTCRLNVFPILFLTFIVKEKNISGKKKEREKGRKKWSVSIWLKAKEWIVGTLSCLLERRQSTSHSGKKWCVIYHIWRQMITGNELVGWGKDILLVVAYL